MTKRIQRGGIVCMEGKALFRESIFPADDWKGQSERDDDEFQESGNDPK